MNEYYIITEGPEADSIYGDQTPVCLSENEVRRLSQEWETDLFQVMHEASEEELKTYGTAE